MTDHLWADGVDRRLAAALGEVFPGVPFAVTPLAGVRTVGIDVAWTDGPPLHRVDLSVQSFVLEQGLAAWEGASPVLLDRISKRRAMSPDTESLLWDVLMTRLGVQDLDPERLYPQPSLGVRQDSPHREATAGELLDQLFESSSFISRVPALGGTEPAGFLCRCPACPLG